MYKATEKHPKEIKKYWIKDLTENQAIHAPTEDISDKLCKKFHELGMKWSSGGTYIKETNWKTYKDETCYLPKLNQYSDKDFYMSEPYEILTIDQLLDFQKYPKVMEVSNDGLEWYQRVLLMEKNGEFLAWAFAESIEASERENNVCRWRYARETQPLPTLYLTLQEIADKFGVSVDRLKIKK